MIKPLLILSAIVSFCIAPAFAQVPVINYGAAKTFVTGTAIAPVVPTNTGGAIPNAFYGEVKAFPNLGIDDFYPIAIAADASGTIYLSNMRGRIVKVTPAGVATPFVGGEASGNADGTGAEAGFTWVTGMAFDAKGDLYASEQLSNRIRKITPAGVVTTFVGSAMGLKSPMGITFDKEGDLYISDNGNNKIRKITPAGVISSLNVTIYGPQGITSRPDGTLHVTGERSALSGYVHMISNGGNSSQSTPFKGPRAITNGPGGQIFVADTYAGEIQIISPDGRVSLLAGNGKNLSSGDGVGDKAGFYSLNGIAYSQGKLYVIDGSVGSTVRTVALTGYTVSPALPDGLSLNSKTGEITGTPLVKAAAKEYTVTATNAAGSGTAKITIGVNIPAEMPALLAADKLTAGPGQVIKLIGHKLAGVTAVSVGGVPASSFFDRNNTELYVVVGPGASSGNIVVTNPYGSSTLPGFTLLTKPVISYAGVQPLQPGTSITPLLPSNTGGDVPAVEYGRVITIAGNGSVGRQNGPTKTSTLNYPTAVSVDKRTGDIYFTESNNNMVRKISADSTVSWVAGSAYPGFENGPAAKASFYGPSGIAIDASGTILVADQYNNVIRKISTDGMVSTFAGSGNNASTDGTGTAASFSGTTSITLSDGNIAYVTESGHKRIRKVSPSATVTTLTDLYDFSYATDNPLGIALSPDGNLYASTRSQVYKVTNAGVVSRFGPSYPEGKQVTVDPSGNLYLISGFRLLRIAPNGTSLVVAGGLINGTKDGIGVNAFFNSPNGITYSLGKLYVTEPYGNTIRQVSVTGYTITPALPEGLAIDSKTGIISGMPTQASPATEYTITAANEMGQSQTKITLQVGTVNTGPQNITFRPTINAVYGTADLDPGATSTNKVLPITYTSYNTNIATIVNGKIHIVGAGTVKIVASQIGDGVTQGSADATATLVVSPAPLTIKPDDLVVRAPYVDNGWIPTTLSYTGLVSEDDIAKFTYAPSLRSTAKSHDPVGVYPITIAYAASPNYNITFLEGKLFIIPPVNNLKMAYTSVPCKGSSAGTITLTAASPAAYTAKLTKAGVTSTYGFSTATTIDKLTAGTYNVCVTINGIANYQQCFDVTITEPKDLSVYSVVDKANGTVQLALNGGENYNISLNGANFKATGNAITLPLKKGKNKLSVTAGTACQGVVNKDIDLYYGVMTPFPNPFHDVLQVNLGDVTVKSAVLKLYNVSTGVLVKTQQYNDRSGVITLDVASLDNGVYSLRLTADGTDSVFKVIKK